MPFGRRQQQPTAPRSVPPVELARMPSPPLQVDEAVLCAPQPVRNETFNPNIVPASREFIAFLMSRYDTDGHVHAESVIGAAAALTGEFAQRAAGIAFGGGNPGYVFGDAINEVLLEGKAKGRATVWDCIAQVARAEGLSEREIPDPLDVMKRVAETVGGPEFPPLTVPKKHYPHEYSPSACVRLRPGILAIADRYDLSRDDLCIALAFTTAGLIAVTKDMLAPQISVRLAAEIAFGVAKMAPLTEPIG